MDRKYLEVEEGDKNIAAVEVEVVLGAVAVEEVLKEGNDSWNLDSFDYNFDRNVVEVVGVEEGFDFLVVVAEGMAYTTPFFLFSISLITVSKTDINQ